MSTPVSSAPADGRVAQRLLLRHGVPLGAFVRFLFVGATNTLLTGVLLIVLAQWIEMEIAYTIVFSLGLVFTTIVAGPFVFRSRLSAKASGRFMSWCLCVYLAGVIVARLATRQWHVSHLLTAVAIIAVTAPLNFFGGRRAFVKAG
ncbi:MAG TPA: GtrA family protein [Solirubrobacteraceae bacterium]|jgi:putative flippase GtrA|nr:GtrA family protein [Solirubrobacteraceae bacterium]